MKCLQKQTTFHGANLLPEGLETGEFKVGGTAEIDELETLNVVAYSGNTILFEDGGTPVILGGGGFIANGIAQSLNFIFCSNADYWRLQMALSIGSQSEYIISAFTVPKLALSDFMIADYKIYDSTTISGIYSLNDRTYTHAYNQTPTFQTLIPTPATLDGYTPKNNKLRTYPYLYLGFNPSNGSSKIYRYEDFNNGTPSFKIISEINPNPSVFFIPQNYRGSSGDSMSDIASLNGYPTLSSRTDVFNSWLAQNSNIIGINMAQEQFNYEIDATKTGTNIGSNIVNSAVKGDIGSAITGGITGGLDLASLDVNHEYYIKNQLAQIEKQKMLPDKVTLASSNSTLLGYNLIDKNIFTRYSIKSEFAKRIDKFFTMYGYLTNTVKVPNTNNRSNWNYIKTIGLNVIADIPQEDLQTIKNIFDNGVTLWHNSNTFLDYSQENN